MVGGRLVIEGRHGVYSFGSVKVGGVIVRSWGNLGCGMRNAVSLWTLSSSDVLIVDVLPL